MMAVSRLLGRAAAAGSCPTASIFCACRNCCSSRFSSVTSREKPTSPMT